MNSKANNYKLRVDPAIFAAHPDYLAYVIYAENLVNGESDQYTVDTLRDAENQARSTFAGHENLDNLHIEAWREAFREFRAKPRKYFCGAEALLRRVIAGDPVPAINQVVDLYNAISIKYAIPTGGEDWNGLASDLTLHRSNGSETFATMTSGGEQIDTPRSGEIVWSDSLGVTVRRWNWRQCHRTRVTTETTRAYFVLDRLEPLEREILIRAGQELVTHLKLISPNTIVSTEILSAKG